MGVIKDSRAAQAIKQLAFQIEKVNEGEPLEDWLTSTASLIERIFGKNDELVKQFKWIKMYGVDRNYDRTSSKAILYTLIDTLKYFGYPNQTDRSTPNTNLTSANTIYQTQSILLDHVAGALKGELASAQLLQLRTVLELPGGVNKETLQQMLATLGPHALARMVAQLLSDPQVAQAVLK